MWKILLKSGILMKYLAKVIFGGFSHHILYLRIFNYNKFHLYFKSILVYFLLLAFNILLVFLIPIMAIAKNDYLNENEMIR